MPPTPQDPSTQPDETIDQPKDWQHRLLNPIGYILGISYPLLALSTGARGDLPIVLQGRRHQQAGAGTDHLLGCPLHRRCHRFFQTNAHGLARLCERADDRDHRRPGHRHAEHHPSRFDRPHGLEQVRPGLRLLPAHPTPAWPRLAALEADTAGLWCCLRKERSAALQVAGCKSENNLIPYACHLHLPPAHLYL